jgi:signal transduction histidine kinase/ActR/RegA family two-component response regulator
MPWYIVLLIVLFALFVFLCGAGHLLKCLGMTATAAYKVVNTTTAFISLSTAIYLLPMIPFLMNSLDHNMQELRRQHEATQESKRRLQTFMAFLCHEIRNPLFIITSTISFLEDSSFEEVDEETASSLGLIKQSSELMLRLVNDVLDISRLESGKVEVEKHDFDLHETLEGAITSARAHIREQHAKNVKNGTTTSDQALVGFRFHIDPDVPKLAHGDQVRVLQVCLNLLSNAVKFTDKGYVDFDVSVMDYCDALDHGFVQSCIASDCDDCKRRHDASTETGDFSASLLDDAETGRVDKNKRSPVSDLTVLRIRVEDTGYGIPAEQIDHIFRPYSMAKLAEYRSKGGTGLGLAIVSKLVQIMNGTIRVRSSVGIGSVFEAYLIVERASLSASFASDLPSEQPCTPVTPSTRTASTEIDCSASSMDSLPPAPFLSLSPVLTSVSEHSDPSRDTSPKKKKTFILPPFDFTSGDAVVLVTDDNAMNRKILTRMLKSFNLEYLEACNGQEAVDVMLKSRNHTGDPNHPYIAFVLMDMSMPVMGGCEATAVIRKHGMDVPIMALTAAAIEEGKDGALSAGVDDYATKPILRENLHSKCEKHIIPMSQSASQTIV